jgi:hypothetical protein
MRSYALFSDPATDLAIPAPRPPVTVTATAGNHQVSLSWTASPDGPGITYNVYRTSQPGGTPERIAHDISATSFMATGLTNCQPYYFFVTALKSGFEGAWSHLNNGCGTGGSCLTATPMNPLPPSVPTGLAATDLETGGSVGVQWDAESRRRRRPGVPRLLRHRAESLGRLHLGPDGTPPSWPDSRTERPTTSRSAA